MKFLTFASLCFANLVAVQAHPGHDIQEEIHARALGLQNTPRDISHCAGLLKARGFEKQTVARRAEILRSEREKRGLPTSKSHPSPNSRLFLTLPDPVVIKARDGPSVLKTNHLSPVVYDPQTPLSTIFAGNKSCILVPETTEGPYYVAGELIRSDLREKETQKGIDLILDIQVIDVSTCKPIPNVMVDVWAANATGGMYVLIIPQEDTEPLQYTPVS